MRLCRDDLADDVMINAKPLTIYSEDSYGNISHGGGGISKGKGTMCMEADCYQFLFFARSPVRALEALRLKHEFLRTQMSLLAEAYTPIIHGVQLKSASTTTETVKSDTAAVPRLPETSDIEKKQALGQVPNLV